MLKKIKPVYKLLAYNFLFGAVGLGLFYFIASLITYIGYKNSASTSDVVIQTQEIFMVFLLSGLTAGWIASFIKMFMGMGVSRKRMFTGIVLIELTVAPIIALSNIAITKAFHGLHHFECTYYSFFSPRYNGSDLGGAKFLSEYFIWQITFFLSIVFVAIFIMFLFSKLGNLGKAIFISLFAALPPIAVMFLFTFSFGEGTFFDTKFFQAISVAFGERKYPLTASFTQLCIAVVFATASYLVARRFPQK